MKKILALMLILALALSLAACGADKGGETTTVPEAVTDEVTEVDTTAAPADDTTAAPADDTTAAVTEAASEATTEATTEAASETTTEAKKAPQTKEEIVAYFNTAVNGVKSGAKSAVHHYSKISLAGSTTLPGALNGILKLLGGADKFLGDQLAKNSKGEEKMSDLSGFPVEGESWASKLTAADVKSATCTESNGKYTITITTVADGKSSSVKHGQGHAPKAFNVVLPGVVNDNIPGVAEGIVGTASMDYPSCKATITVDAATGHVEKANYDLYWTINFDKAGAILPFLTSDSYTINW